MNYYGYTRVSSKHQNDDRQRHALLEFGVPEHQIFSDKVSGKDFNRPEYQKLRRKLKKNDVLIIKSLDRLGRNYEEVISEWKYLTCDQLADIVVLDMPLLDTRQNKDLLGTFISDLVLGLLSYVSQTEREMIKQRQLEGIELAKQKGVKFGRPPSEFPPNFEQIYSQYKRRECSKKMACQLLKLSLDDFELLLKRKRQRHYRTLYFPTGA